jgi:hypothetical protein
MGRRHSDHVWLWAFVDVLLVLTFVQQSFNFLALPQINPPTKPVTENIRPAGQISVVVCWARAPIDIDTWGMAPGEEKPVGYNNRAGKILSLNTDNRGETGGNAPANCENMVARDLPAGEYTFNVFGFSVSEPTNVHIEISIGKDGNSMQVHKFDVLVASRQERTVMRFQIDGNGEVVPGSENSVFKPLYIGG